VAGVAAKLTPKAAKMARTRWFVELNDASYKQT
jgi:hypothetical protein